MPTIFFLVLALGWSMWHWPDHAPSWATMSLGFAVCGLCAAIQQWYAHRLQRAALLADVAELRRELRIADTQWNDVDEPAELHLVGRGRQA